MNGRSQRSRKQLAEEIVNDMMRQGPHRNMPFEIARRYSLTDRQARAIYDLSPSHFGPGGRGYDAYVRRVEGILAPRPSTRDHIRKRARRDNGDRYAMLNGIRDALWLPAWADAEEERGGRLPRNITRETAPRAPQSATRLAADYAKALEQLNGVSLEKIHERASAAEGREVDGEELGYYLAMQGLGHGVAWTDGHQAFDVKIPRAEAYATGDEDDWHLEGSVSTRTSTSLRDRGPTPRRTRARGPRRRY